MAEETMGNRSRVVRWSDPAVLPQAARSMSGLQFLEAFLRGELPLPPVCELVRMTLVEVELGRAVFELLPDESMYNPLGCVHGGVVTAVLDSAMGCALHSTLPPGVSYTTLELKVNFARPLTVATGVVRAEGKLIHAGSTVATTEARLEDRAGALFAHATSTLMILRPRGP
jgi:uncharacterized protein (TIGR00369 family)